MVTPTDILPGFAATMVHSGSGDVFMRVGGGGPPVLLLHGFPETHLMWHALAPVLAERFTVILADLPGYGRSACPPAGDAGGSKRAMAATLVAAMVRLGHDRFSIVGHDRGGRVAYRAALDHAEVVERVAVLDVVPTIEVWDCADDRLALAFWPFSLLAQPAPLPEELISASPGAVIANALSEWGSPPQTFPDWLRAAYIEGLSDPAHVHAICEEYRAAAGIDREHDRADLDAGNRIDCPLLALWSASGGLSKWYETAGGPFGLWRRWARKVEGEAIEGGHFFPEECPELVARRLATFLAG